MNVKDNLSFDVNPPSVGLQANYGLGYCGNVSSYGGLQSALVTDQKLNSNTES